MGASAIGLSHVAVQFPVYEFFKRWLGERRQKERGEATVADRLSTVDLIVASSTSKVIGSVSLPPEQLPAYQLAVCASVATVTPAEFSACPCSPALLRMHVLLLTCIRPFQWCSAISQGMLFLPCGWLGFNFRVQFNFRLLGLWHLHRQSRHLILPPALVRIGVHAYHAAVRDM